MRKAFVIELFGHEMCLLSVVQVLNDCEGLEVNVISSDSVKANVMKSSFYPEDVEWHDVRTEEPISNRPLKNASNFKRVLTDVLKTVSSLSERNDLVLINTVECDLCHLLLRNLVEPLNVKGLKVFIGIHNSFLFMSGFAAELEKDLRRYYRLPLENRFRKKHLPLFLSTLMAEIVLRYRRTGLRSIAASVAGYYVFGEQVITPNNSKTRLVFSAKPVNPDVVKLRRKRIGEIMHSDDKLVFTVTGKVDLYRRDYISVLKSFEHIDASKFQLVFLGEFADPIVRDLVNNSLIRSSITTFDRRVSEDEFEYWISKTDFIIAPVSEIPPYGKFKISGNPGDALSAGTPLIIPQCYYEGNTPQGTLSYTDSDSLKEKIEELIEDRNYAVSISNQALNRTRRVADGFETNAYVCRILGDI
ncbi:MAG TPA: hypothetical protein PLO21_05430 [Mesotoga sp.]|nr:glycosyltransferase [Mesotoga sp.]MDD4039609.1 hypothetical protein [Mesotoga sp.]MDD5745015.1 hypothetical protein [Mesotoga sp.]HPX22927.1 hypothetical protein [Mesotoga sp.]HQC56473.1 hypothetical protein [Mesotoga sp.]